MLILLLQDGPGVVDLARVVGRQAASELARLGAEVVARAGVGERGGREGGAEEGELHSSKVKRGGVRSGVSR